MGHSVRTDDSAHRQSPLLQMDCPPEGFDLLVVDPDEQRSVHLVRELSELLTLRVAERSSGREALASISRARFDAVIVRQFLGDTDCWRLIRMIRSGRFGFAAVPVFVLCTEIEREALEPLLDPHTLLVLEDDIDAMCESVSGVREGLSHRGSVLVIEDEAQAAFATVLALHKYYRVEAASTGRQGLQFLQARKHDLVLLDLRLPDLPGEEVLREIMKNNPRQAVIVLTASDAVDQYQDLMFAGALEFLSKPTDLHMLPEACAKVLQQNAYLANVDRSIEQEHEVAELVGRVRAAQYTLERGQTAHAVRHLRRAVMDSPTHELSDDGWARLLGEVDY